MKSNLAKPDGFTLIEVATVIVLVSFLTVAMLAYYHHSDTELIAQTNILKTHIRYAQARAMNTNTPWGIYYKASDRVYWLFKGADTGPKIPLPGQTADVVDLNKDDMDLDIIGGDFSLIFDSWGRPKLTYRSFSDGQLKLKFNRHGEDDDPIIVTENTGFIP